MEVFLKIIFTAGLFLGMLACSTVETNNTGLPLMEESEIKQTIEQFSAHQQVYDGLYNAIDMTVTMRNSKVIRAQLAQRARQSQWDRTQFQLETANAEKKAKAETEIFLSFFTPDHKNDDLHKGKTAWKVYLEADGHRWEGKVTKLKFTLAELKAMYPKHNPFGTPYLISFPVGIESVEDKAAKFTVTGPLGAGVANFTSDGASPR